MNDNNIQLEAEIKRLTLKCDKQLDYIKEQEKQLEEKQLEIKRLISTTAYSIAETDTIESNGKVRFISIFDIFYKVVNEAIKNNDFFENKRSTENSKKYRVIDFHILSSHIEKFTNGYSVKKIVQLWADLGLIYKDENDSYFVNFTHEKKSVRSVRVNKAAVAIVKECIIYD